MENVTIDELQEKCKILFSQRDDYEEKKRISSEALALYEETERQLVELLLTVELKNFQSSSGLISIRKKEYYPIPKSSEDKLKIRKYLEDKGIFDETWSIHSQKYNSWVKQELEIAREEKRFLNLPGVEAPTISFDLAMKKNEKQ